MSYTDVNTPVIEKITLPSGNSYFIADREIRDVVDTLSQAIAGGVTYVIAWDGTSTPVVANIPAGVTVVYDGTSYTGTLSANSATPGAFYLVKSATTQNSLKISYDSATISNITVNMTTFRTYTQDATNTTYEFAYGQNSWNNNFENYGISYTGTPQTYDTITIVTPDSYLDVYDEYVPIGSSGSKTWEKIGDTQIDLSDVVTGVTLNKQTDTVIGTDATFTVTDPYVNLGLETPQGEPRLGSVEVVTGITSASASGDTVTAITSLGSPSTKSAIGSNATFTITQPTVTLATDSSSGTGKVQVMTGLTGYINEDHTITAVTGYNNPTSDTFLKGVKVTTQPSVTLTANSSTGTGRIQYVQSQGSATTTKLSASASGGAVSASGDSVTALTGLGSPSTKSAIGASSTFTVTQPTITVATDTTSGTGKVQVATGISSVSASGDNVTALTGLGTPTTADVASSVTPTTKKLEITTITGVSGSTTPDVVKTRSTQITATGGGTSSSANTDWLRGVSVSNGVLTIGAATLNTQTTYSAGTPSSITIPKAASSATTVATGSVTTSGSGADVVTDVAVGDTVAAVTGYASPTTDTVLGTGSTISVTPSTTYIKATASGAGVAWNSKDTVAAVTGYASPTTDTVLGTASSFSVTDPTITIASGSTGDVTVATGIGAATTKYLSASASGTAVDADGTGSALTGLGTASTQSGVVTTDTGLYLAPTTTYIKATASGANTAWNSKDAVTAVTGYASPTTDTVLGEGTTITVTPEKEYLFTATSGTAVAWNNKDSVTVLKSTTDVNVTKGA